MHQHIDIEGKSRINCYMNLNVILRSSFPDNSGSNGEKELGYKGNLLWFTTNLVPRFLYVTANNGSLINKAWIVWITIAKNFKSLSTHKSATISKPMYQVTDVTWPSTVNIKESPIANHSSLIPRSLFNPVTRMTCKVSLNECLQYYSQPEPTQTKGHGITNLCHPKSCPENGCCQEYFPQRHILQKSIIKTNTNQGRNRSYKFNTSKKFWGKAKLVCTGKKFCYNPLTERANNSC